MALMFLYVFYIREMIKKGLKLFYFYITSANEVIMTLVYAMETNKVNFEKEV
jgi:hypothetical protein